jgi:hypothetical protein
VQSLIVKQEDSVNETGLRDAGGWVPEGGGGGDGSRPRQQGDRHTAEEGNANHATTLEQQPRGVLTYPGGVEINDDDISFDCSSMSSSIPEEKSSNQAE